jgi:excisionase family DNA binding protein
MDAVNALVREIAADAAEQIKAELETVLADLRRRALPLMLDVEQLMEQLGLSETTVRGLWKSGELPSVKIGGLRFTRREDLLAYVAGLPLARVEVSA